MQTIFTKETLKLFVLAFILSLPVAFAAPLTIQTKCEPVLNDQSLPTLLITSTARSTFIKVGDLGTYRQLSDVEYEGGIQVRWEPLKTPSGVVNTVLRFFSISAIDESTSESPEPFKEQLYHCEMEQ